MLPVAAQPESILYFYLTTPRVAAPRWFHEGIAVFVDTWMAGGLGRAQSGYDEMVFRSMVKDDAPFYDPLGLVSEGTKVDFQLEANSYLYGTRFMTWLARHYSPEKVIDWTARRDGSRAYYSSAFRQQFGVGLSEAWANWVKDEHTFQEVNLAAIRQHPVTPYRDVTTRPLGSVSRAYFDEKTDKIFAAFNYPGVVSHVGAIDATSGAIERLVAIKGPAMHTVASLAWDPDAPNAVLHDRQQRLARSDAPRSRDRQDAAASERRAHRRPRLRPGRQIAARHSPLQRRLHARADPRAVHAMGAGALLAVWDRRLRPRRLARRRADRRVVRRRSAGKQDVRVISLDALPPATPTPIAQFDFGPSVPNSFIFSPRRPLPLRQLVLHRRLEHLPLRHRRRRQLDAVSNTETGSSGRCRSAATSSSSFDSPGGDSCRRGSRPAPSRMSAPITFLGERLSEEHPIVRDWNVGSPLTIPYDSLKKELEAVRLARQSAAGIDLSDRPGLQGHGGGRACG